MVTQKMISLKLDVNQLEMLDELAARLCTNRNKLINFAVYMLNSNMNLVNQCALVAAYQSALSEVV